MITKNQIKYIRGLSLKKNRMKEQCFIVEGEKSLLELLASSFQVVELFAVKDWINNNKEVSERVQEVS
ncbi:MAG: RNA methyltransferase, partial [Bacteroidota bacterium]|nr:RNA methyltransferase [Bacteroidota bacterium]